MAIDGVHFKNGSNQPIMTVFDNSEAVAFEGSIICERHLSALTFDNVDVKGWIKTNEYLQTNTIQAYDTSQMMVDNNLTVGGNLAVSGNTTFTGTVSGIPIGGATQAALDLKANLNHATFLGTATTNNLDISNAMKCNSVSSWNTDKVTVDDSLAVPGVLKADTICSRIADRTQSWAKNSGATEGAGSFRL